MIQMRVGEQYVVDGGGVKAENSGIFLVQFAATLMQPAIDKDALARAFDQMTGARDTAIGPWKDNFKSRSRVFANLRKKRRFKTRVMHWDKAERRSRRE
jgi:hypothetical protein